MNEIQLNRNDDDYALISYVCAYSLQTFTFYKGHIHKVKKAQNDERLFSPHFYVLSFDYADFALKIELDNLNTLIRDFEARSRIRGLIPLIDRSIYQINTLEI
jgi:hypothetical protein